jgi:glycosyltransferase involved in cell wall biosynthesis
MSTAILHPRVSVVICTLNEEKNLQAVLPKIPRWVFEIIIVDGHSSDHTVEVAKMLRPDAKILYQPHEGKGDAFKFGVAASNGEIIVTLDADGTYAPEEIRNFVAAIVSGNDFAKGTRFLGLPPIGISPKRRLGNILLAFAVNFLVRSRYTDVCSGYYAFKKEVFQRINLLSNGFEMEQELFVKIIKMKLKVIEVPHSYSRRVYGTSKTRDFRQGIKDLLWIVLFSVR